MRALTATSFAAMLTAKKRVDLSQRLRSGDASHHGSRVLSKVEVCS